MNRITFYSMTLQKQSKTALFSPNFLAGALKEDNHMSTELIVIFFGLSS